MSSRVDDLALSREISPDGVSYRVGLRVGGNLVALDLTKLQIAGLLRRLDREVDRFDKAAAGDALALSELRELYDRELLEYLRVLGAEAEPEIGGSTLEELLDVAWEGCLLAPTTIERLRRNATQKDCKQIKTVVTVLRTTLNVNFPALVDATLTQGSL